MSKHGLRSEAHPFNGQLLYLAKIFTDSNVAHWEDIQHWEDNGFKKIIETGWCDQVEKGESSRLLGVTAFRGFDDSHPIHWAHFSICEDGTATSIDAMATTQPEKYINLPPDDDPFAAMIIDGFIDYLIYRRTTGIADCTSGVSKDLVSRFGAFELELPVKKLSPTSDYMLVD